MQDVSNMLGKEFTCPILKKLKDVQNTVGRISEKLVLVDELKKVFECIV